MNHNRVAIEHVGICIRNFNGYTLKRLGITLKVIVKRSKKLKEYLNNGNPFKDEAILALLPMEY